MKEIPERPLTELEYVIISKLLEHPFPGSEEIKQQTKSPTVISAADDDNYGSIYFKTEGSEQRQLPLIIYQLKVLRMIQME